MQRVECTSFFCKFVLCGAAGEPKAIPWTHVTPMRAGADAFFHQDVRQRDVLCWPTNMGWMMGPGLVYAGGVVAAARACGQGLYSDKQQPLAEVECGVSGWRVHTGKPDQCTGRALLAT